MSHRERTRRLNENSVYTTSPKDVYAFCIEAMSRLPSSYIYQPTRDNHQAFPKVFDEFTDLFYANVAPEAGRYNRAFKNLYTHASNIAMRPTAHFLPEIVRGIMQETLTMMRATKAINHT